MDYFARFTDDAKRVLSHSAECAREFGHNYIGTEHLLLALAEDGGAMADTLGAYDVTAERVRKLIERAIGKGDFVFNSNFGYTPRVKKILELSKAFARQMGKNYVGSECLLLAILNEGECLANRIIMECGADPNAVTKGMLKKMSKNKPAQEAEAESSTPKLDKFGRDLTLAAKNGELDPVIGREEEVERIVQILIRRTKNNPVLIGEPGVGKSAIVEGLAERIAEGRIPELLENKRVFSLDLAGMLAGAKYRGDFEERFKDALAELAEDKNVILFIDELHTIVGAGASEGSLDAANMLKPMLARSEIQVIGATTLDEYRKYIEKDAALERRFQPVTVGEPSLEETLLILKGLRDKYEAHHKVRITDEALKAAVELSDRYISDRFLPDKAVDLMDEAASRVRIRMFQKGTDVRELEKRADMLKAEKEQAVETQDFERAAKLRDEEKEVLREIEDIRNRKEKERGTADAEVTEEDIAEVVSAWTQVPVKKLTEDESQRLLDLENILHKRVIGQHEAISAVSKAIRRARAGLKDPSRPIGSFIFLGPTGVGKTELTKALAEAMFGSEDAMIRLDMSEYMERHTVSKLIGSPPGYVGFDEGGQLTEKVRRKPYSVVLFDEIEKAHPDVFNALLQILEDGRLTDSKGRTVNFKNTIIIMTSNVGAHSIEKKARIGFGAADTPASQHEDMREQILTELKKQFRPEFINRVDDLIVFHKLAEEDILAVSRLMLDDIAKRLTERNIHLSYTEAAAEVLAKKGYDAEYGARPLRRLLQQEVEDKLSEEILEGHIAIGDKVLMDAADGKIVFESQK